MTIATLEKDFARQRTLLLFSGDYDRNGAVLTISAGAGGTEATDWARCSSGCISAGPRATASGPRSSTDRGRADRDQERHGHRRRPVRVRLLRPERGVHRLVRISPYDAQKRRQTTFGLVEVMPEVDDDAAIELDWDEIDVGNYRSSSAGGQHVQKTNSAVQLISPHRDRRRDPERTLRHAEPPDRREGADGAAAGATARERRSRQLRGEHVEAGWGNQIGATCCTPTRWSRT